MSLFKRKDKKDKDKDKDKDEPSKAMSKSLSSPDIAGNPKGGNPPASAQGNSLTLTKEQDEQQEDDRLEERKRLWTKVSGLVGKDIASLISLPVSFFEPISVLQSMAEPMRNSQLLEQACSFDDPVERLVRVAAFCVSLFSYYVRTAKPFNPVLGETFEYEPESKAYRTLAEQVSHHPPVGICQTVSKDWYLTQESRIETKFWGTSVDVNSLGNNVLHITKYNEEIRWNNPTAVIHNIILGRLWIEYHGQLPITNMTTGHSTVLNFKKQTWFGSGAFEVNGEVRDKEGKVRAIISGNWKEKPYCSYCKVDDAGKKGEMVELWRKVVTPEEKSHKYKWDPFIHKLAGLNSELEVFLPASDSRLRGDLRALGALNTKLAGKEKIRIEENERQKRKQREAAGKKWEPVFFTKVADEKFEYRWEYTGRYWEEREQRAQENKEKKQNGATASEESAKQAELAAIPEDEEEDNGQIDEDALREAIEAEKKKADNNGSTSSSSSQVVA